jgi:LmbE family N-acetylglucosaminyl deacetylase
MVVVAHPDDEVLGVGGLIHMAVNDYHCDVHVVILGEGITSRADERNIDFWKDDLSVHQGDIVRAQAFLGYQSLSTYQMPDNRFDTVPLLDLVKIVENEKRSFRPNVIFTHHGGDVNIDHQKTFEAVLTAARPLPGESVRSLFTFETMSGTEWRVNSDPRHFLPNVFVGLTDRALEAKFNAIEAYSMESRPFPHPRSKEALRIRAKSWGIANGVDAAEAFALLRFVVSPLR